MLYMSADGGGTKLIVLLYDENFRLISKGVSGGTNVNFRPLEDVREDMRDALYQCLGDSHPVIEMLSCVIVGPGEVFLEEAKKLADIRRFDLVNEGQMALMAGAGTKWGMLALSGTGSDVFVLQPEWTDFIGGWGTILGDEGSGYDLGAKALRAAIWAHDGRGPDSLILPYLMEAWKLQVPWDMVPKVYGERDPRRLVASVTRIAAKAACDGDEVAKKLFADAGHELALLVRAVMKKHRDGIEGPVVISGGTWKGYSGMYDAFREEVNTWHPELVILKPEFEPIIGGLVWQAMERGMKKEEFWPVLQKEYGEYRYG